MPAWPSDKGRRAVRRIEMVVINLWNPSNVDLASALIISFLLGLVHGITPDEHTWPITFSYSVNQRGSKEGARAGMIFATGFTIQRAVMSEVAYFALAGIFLTALSFGITYIFVGIAMAAAGVYFARRKGYFHIHTIETALEHLLKIHERGSADQKREMEHTSNPLSSRDGVLSDEPIPAKLAFVHGLIAGFGFGAFALILYLVIAPSMPSPWFGFLPGLLFGLGTMAMQLMFGAFFVSLTRRVGRLTDRGISFVTSRISMNVLLYGGIAFVLSGLAILFYPALMNIGFNTGIKIHNLDNLGIGFFLVLFSVGIVGIVSFILSVRRAKELGLVVKGDVIAETT
jgi:sulfite exporter TauE/SafE